MKIITGLFWATFSLSLHADDVPQEKDSLQEHNSSQNIVRLTSGEWAPYTSEKLQNYGVFSHIVTEAFALEGIKVEYKFFPWKRSYTLAKEGLFDGSLTWIPTPDRENDFYFSEAVTYNKKVFFHLKSYLFDWKTMNDLKGLTIGATRSYSYGKEFDQAVAEQELDIQYVNYDKQNIKKLIAKRIQIFPMEKEVGYNLIQNELSPKEASLVTSHSKEIHQAPVSVVISKKIDTKRSQWLIKSFNRGLRRLKESGKYQEMLSNSRQGKYKL